MFYLYTMLFLILILKYVYTYNVEISDKIIAVADSNVVDEVKNFYRGVILKFKIPNFSVMVQNPSSYKEFEKYNIPVENSPIDVDDGVADPYHSKEFLRKVNTRLKIIPYYLKQNLTILNMDADLWFFKKPFRTNEECKSRG